MNLSPSERAYVERTERERKEKFARFHAEGCPLGFEAEWESSGKFRMKIREKGKR